MDMNETCFKNVTGSGADILLEDLKKQNKVASELQARLCAGD
jgi:hypothetical protein